MSRETIQFPSGKQILSYEHGDLNLNDVHDFFRFHSGNKYFWIEKTVSIFRVCFRGATSTDFVSSFKVLYESVDLDDCIIFYHSAVYHYLGGKDYVM